MKILSVFTLFFVVLSCDSFAFDNKSSDFIDFVRLSSRVEKSGEREFIWSWPKVIPSCVFGDYNQADKSLVDVNVRFVSEVTNINFINLFKKTVRDCPQDTLLYLRFHSKGSHATQLILDDVEAVDGQKGRGDSAVHRSVSDLGGIFYSFGGNLPPYIFLSIINSGETPFLGSNEVAEELLQKSLFLSITGVPDQLRLGKFPSFLHDPVSSITDKPRGILETTKRRTNLCLFDVMLLRTLYNYSDSQYNLSGLLKVVKNNYTAIESFSKEIYFKSSYSRIFPKKC